MFAFYLLILIYMLIWYFKVPILDFISKKKEYVYFGEIRSQKISFHKKLVIIIKFIIIKIYYKLIGFIKNLIREYDRATTKEQKIIGIGVMIFILCIFFKGFIEENIFKQIFKYLTFINIKSLFILLLILALARLFEISMIKYRKFYLVSSAFLGFYIIIWFFQPNNNINFIQHFESLFTLNTYKIIKENISNKSIEDLNKYTPLFLLCATPVLYVLWYIRDYNRNRDIENHIKDIEINKRELNLKDFNRISQMACNIHLNENTNEHNLQEINNNKLFQIVALNQLEFYLNGKLGNEFQNSAIIILNQLLSNSTNIIKNKIINNLEINKDDIFYTCERIFNSNIKLILDYNNNVEIINKDKYFNYSGIYFKNIVSKFRNFIIYGNDYSGKEFNKVYYENGLFNSVNFNDIFILKSVFNKVEIIDSKFQNSKFLLNNFTSIEIINCDFSIDKVKKEKFNFDRTIFYDCTLNKCSLENSGFLDSQIQNTTVNNSCFKSTNALIQLKIINSELTNTEISENACIEKLLISNSILNNINFITNSLKDSAFYDIKINLNLNNNTGFSYSDFSNNYFNTFEILNSKIKLVNFTECRFLDTKIIDTTLENISFEDSKLIDTIFYNVNFVNINFAGVRFENVKLYNIDLESIENLSKISLFKSVEIAVFVNRFEPSKIASYEEYKLGLANKDEKKTDELKKALINFGLDENNLI